MATENTTDDDNMATDLICLDCSISEWALRCTTCNSETLITDWYCDKCELENFVEYSCFGCSRDRFGVICLDCETIGDGFEMVCLPCYERNKKRAAGLDVGGPAETTTGEGDRNEAREEAQRDEGGTDGDDEGGDDNLWDAETLIEEDTRWDGDTEISTEMALGKHTNEGAEGPTGEDT